MQIALILKSDDNIKITREHTAAIRNEYRSVTRRTFELHANKVRTPCQMQQSLQTHDLTL